jgi:hypothetical protein
MAVDPKIEALIARRSSLQQDLEFYNKHNLDCDAGEARADIARINQLIEAWQQPTV